MTIHLLHFADLHLGVENYGRLDPETGLHSRVRDFVAALASVVDLAISEKVDLVLFAGDAYKTCDPTPTCQREFALQVRRLQQAGIPLALVVGNHDAPVAFGKATSLDIFSALELDGTYVFRRPQLLRLETPRGPVQIAGLPWPTRSILRTHEAYKNLSQEELTARISAICAAQIEEFARQLDPSLPAILAAHLAAAEATYSGSEHPAIIGRDPTLLTSALAHPAFDYVALGHVHKHQDLNPGRRPPVVYAGSLERIDFGEERDEKGVCLVEIESTPQGRATRCEFVPRAARRFTTLQVEVEEGEDPTRKIVEVLGKADIEEAVVRLFYSLPSGSTSPIDLESVHQALASAFCVAGIIPQTEPAVRLRRASVSEELNLGEALDRYIDNIPDLQEHRDLLQQYARALAQELELSTDERAED